MRDKHHEYILRAFLAVKIPDTIRRNAAAILVTDSLISDFCNRLLLNERRFHMPDITREYAKDRDMLIELMGKVDDYEREELMDYYRLLMLTISVLKKYGTN